MAYRICKALINTGNTAGLADKIDVFYAAGRLTDEQYTELIGLLNDTESKN